MNASTGYKIGYAVTSALGNVNHTTAQAYTRTSACVRNFFKDIAAGHRRAKAEKGVVTPAKPPKARKTKAVAVAS